MPHGIRDIGHDSGMLAEGIHNPGERDTSKGDVECRRGDTVSGPVQL